MKQRRLLILAILLAIIFIPCLAQENSSKKRCQAHFSLEDSIPSVNFEEFLASNIVFTDNGADAMTMCYVEFEVVGDGIIDNVNVTSLGHVDFVEIAVKESVIKSARYWLLDCCGLGDKARMEFKFKWMLQ